MNLLASIVTIMSTRKEKIGTSSSEAIIAVTEDSAEQAADAQVYGQHGFVTRPAKGGKGLRLRIGNLNIIIAGFRFDIPGPDNPGETKLYSTDADGVEKSTHVLTDDGKHVFNGGEDFAVRFSALETAFNQLKQDHNTHVHVETGGSTAAPTVPSTASVADAKVRDVLVPTKAAEA